jgi:hypothetical protein
MFADRERVRAQERAQDRQAKGQALAPTLVGLDGEEAVRRATEQGFEAQVVPHTVEAVTADLNHNRLRLFLNENGIVVRAHAG